MDVGLPKKPTVFRHIMCDGLLVQVRLGADFTNIGWGAVPGTGGLKSPECMYGTNSTNTRTLYSFLKQKWWSPKTIVQ